MRLASRPTVALCLSAALAAPLRAAWGQEPASAADSLRLGMLQQQATQVDPRQHQFGLLAKQTDLRLHNLSAERLPSFSTEGVAQYQSETIDASSVFGNAGIPTPNKDSYDSRLKIEQSIFDPTINARKKVETASLAQSEAGVRTSLHPLRQEVNDAFFSGALLAEQRRIIAVTITDLEKQLEEARIRVKEGAALPSDTGQIQATLLLRRQDEVEVEAKRKAAVIKLTVLVQQPVSTSSPFVLPDLTAQTAQAQQGLDSLRARPEFTQYARSRDLLARQSDALSADRQPKISLFGQAGFGRPGLNPISDTFHGYYLGGIQVKWAPWNWGSTGRERQALETQARIVATEEAAFKSRLSRQIQDDLADIERLDTAQALDDQIVSLREAVAAETGIRFHEGVVTASEYVDRSTDVLQARLARATHRVEQVEARARLLTTLGLEIQ
jgi:outer membrane protein TolC